MKSRNITMRLTIEELEYFDSIAKKVNINRTEMMRRAVRNYGENIDKKEASIIEKAKDIVISNDIAKSVEQHPFVKKVIDEGLEVSDMEGNVITKLETMEELLDFVMYNVFFNPKKNKDEVTV